MKDLLPKEGEGEDHSKGNQGRLKGCFVLRFRRKFAGQTQEDGDGSHRVKNDNQRRKSREEDVDVNEGSDIHGRRTFRRASFSIS